MQSTSLSRVRFVRFFIFIVVFIVVKAFNMFQKPQHVYHKHSIILIVILIFNYHLLFFDTARHWTGIRHFLQHSIFVFTICVVQVRSFNTTFTVRLLLRFKVIPFILVQGSGRKISFSEGLNRLFVYLSLLIALLDWRIQLQRYVQRNALLHLRHHFICVYWQR
jgi:hypothetical protein